MGVGGGKKKKNELLTFSEQHLLYLVTTALQRAPFTHRGGWGGGALAVCVACRAWIAIGSQPLLPSAGEKLSTQMFPTPELIFSHLEQVTGKSGAVIPPPCASGNCL